MISDTILEKETVEDSVGLWNIKRIESSLLSVLISSSNTYSIFVKV